ncbi:MAG: serpin family protein [Firmicutes bacterium]|nr:serpin family protein [Bacillota bacterium]
MVSKVMKKSAAGYPVKRRNNKWHKWAVVTACVVLALVLTLLIPSLGFRKSPGAVQKVIYPKAYAIDDYDAEREVREQNPVADSFLAALANISYKTGSVILANAGRNINYSPLSLYYALSLAASGARNETEAELLALLGVADTAALSQQCGNLYRLLYRDNEIGRLKIANSLWLDDEVNGVRVEFKKSFVQNAVENFYASVHRVNFAGAEAGKAMAAWVADNTNGRLLPDFETDPQQILSILNTIYFYDQWIDRFDESNTAEDVFYLADGGKVKCDFMHQTLVRYYALGDGFTRSGLGLKNRSRMVFILPNEGISPADLLSSPEKMREVFNGGEEIWGEVVWKVPKFSFKSNLLLTDVISNLGVSSAFTPEADFGGITDQPAFITNIRQDTQITIDEKGVEASAFTLIDYAGSALPEGRVKMNLDRPFIYGITAENGSLLFVGICENPAAQ